ncbi:putative exported protein [Collimonas arenae]|uniref:Putative exported protein n=1 Tax=Collimonas arenae TaxID=279058 RepID=A0A127PWC3_9BURK|nr:carboxypeptidase-like regulatory domain-containing protein [Collimonas arenae]AMP02140.1 putative exported protein [Collimonas arenae]AMP12036.1 putative exported protein [Collimonas arenae]
MNKQILFALAALITATAAVGANAAQAQDTRTAAAAAGYLSGGIGEDEAATMQREAKNYPLELEFVVKATPKDEFTADVHVKISDAHSQTVLDAVSKGPFFLAQLPPGRYRIEAIKNGQSKTRDVAITTGSHQHIMFEWIE